MDLFAKPRRSAITHADGSSLSIFNGQPVAGDANFYNGTCGSHDLSFSTDATPVSTAVGASYFLADQLGTTQMELSGSGTVLWQGAFTPFGQEIINGTTATYIGPQPADGTTNHYKFTGKERDAESGFDYFGARYYGSGMGRWTTPDWSAKAEPVPYSKLDDPQSLNLYNYVGNNPLRRVDLDGHRGSIPSADAACLNKGICTGDTDPAHLQDPANNQQAQQNGSNAGVPAVLPNGSNVPDPNSTTGVMMSPVGNLSDVAAAGQSAGAEFRDLLQSAPQAAGQFEVASFGAAVGTGGKFDYQRSGNQILGLLHLHSFKHHPQFRDVSNFNVGLFAQKFGLSLQETLTMTGHYAHMFSSNAAPSQPYGLDPRVTQFVTAGYSAGASY